MFSGHGLQKFSRLLFWSADRSQHIRRLAKKGKDATVRTIALALTMSGVTTELSSGFLAQLHNNHTPKIVLFRPEKQCINSPPRLSWASQSNYLQFAVMAKKPNAPQEISDHPMSQSNR